ncbi:MAG: fibronectin type III domain-containing protein, partial [Nitrosopumilaceae archaeon]|nr:fibronectin type III domain-containing protein [Nitrosopumilaceae archaeon]
DRTPGNEYFYKVYAINAIGISPPSNEASEIPTSSSAPPTLGTVASPPQKLTAELISENQVNLSWNKPSINGGSTITGYKIEVKKDDGKFVILSPNTGKSTSYSHTGLEEGATYTYKVFAINGIGTSNPSNLVSISITPKEKEPIDPMLRVPGFPDPSRDPQYYIDRYNNEPSYKEWFDKIFPEYTITDIVGIPEPKVTPPTEREIRINYYLDRYNSEPAYKKWFDSYFKGLTLEDVVPDKPSFGICGEGTELKDGICQIKIRN